MYRPTLATAPLRNSNVRSIRWQDSLARLIPPIFLLISVCATLKYGYFPDRRVLVGPGSSRLVEASSLFVKEMEVRDKKGVLVYGFSEKPPLSLKQNWNMSCSLSLVPANGRKGFSLWLNKGSSLHIRLEAKPHLRVSLTKGEKNREIMEPITNENETHIYEPTKDGMKFDYSIKEDDNYYISIVNVNTIDTINTTIFINIITKMYDVTKAESTCDSSSTGSCRYRIGLLFPVNKFFVLVAPTIYDGGDDGWSVELAFIARIITYIAILGFLVIVTLIVLRYFGAWNSESDEEISVHITSTSVSTEADPNLIRDKTYNVSYGIRVEDMDDDEGSSSSGEDLYDGKICVICYDMMRNCFFVPCGHCATCHNCALRIMEGETKVCPICRRLIHKVRKLLIP